MRNMKYLNAILFIVILCVGCGEDLEDTYKEFSGDGKIRYIAKCSNFEVSPGWKRLHLEWKNGTDAIVDKIKLSWSVLDVKKDTLLPRECTSCDLLNLGDGTYRLDLCAIDKDGHESLVETSYGRPYTENHEIVKTFTNAIIKYYRVGKNLVFYMDKWNEDIIEINLNYVDIYGKKQVYPLSREVFDEEFVTLKEVETDSIITLERKGKLEGCQDTIQFDPIVLGNERTFTSDFKLAIERRYGYSDQTMESKTEFENFIDTVKVLEFDYDISSFEDILYCPQLEKIVLGKNRYIDSRYITSSSCSSLYEHERGGLLVLDKANELLGVRVERFGKHYFGQETRDYMDTRAWPMREVMERLEYILDSDVDTIKCSVKDLKADIYLKDLLDNDPTTWWETSMLTEVRSYELVIELKNERLIHGIKIVQAAFDPDLDRDSEYYLPSSIIIKTSVNKITWQNVTYVEENILGKSPGEITLLPIKEKERACKYIKVIINDGVNDNSITRVKLADIIAY